MRLLSLFLAVLLLAVTIPSVGNAQQVDCGVNPTNPACLKHLQQPGTPTECPPGGRTFNIHQSRRGVLTLNIYDADGVQINVGNPQHNEVKNEYDSICIGPQWFNEGYTFEWCTDDAGRVWSRKAILDYYRGSVPTIELVPSPNNRPHRPEWLPQVQLR